MENIDLEKRTVLSPVESTRTKLRWFTFFNEKAVGALKEYLAGRKGLTSKLRLFPIGQEHVDRVFRKVSKAAEVKITP